MSKIRIAHFVSHPVQYHIPLFQRIALDPDLELKVFYCSSQGVDGYTDPEFQSEVAWDLPMLEGYQHEFLQTLGPSQPVSWWRPFNLGIKKALASESFDALWVHGYARLASIAAVRAGNNLGIPVFLRDDVTENARPRSSWKESLKRKYFRWLEARLRGVFVVGTKNREYFGARGFSDEKLFDLPYSVDNARFQEQCRAASSSREELRKQLGLETTRPVILFAGKLISQKKIDVLIRAHAKLNTKTDLLLVGNGPKRNALMNLAGTLGSDGVHFIDFQNQSELPRYYDLCSCFVLPSEFETWGMAVNEAMNASRAVVVSDRVGCAADLVEPGKNGFIFPSGDVEALTKSLDAICSNNTLATSMGEKSCEIINNYSPDHFVRSLKQVLSSTID